MTDANNGNQRVVSTKQNDAGVNPSTGVRDDVSGKANALLDRAAVETTPTTPADDAYGQKFHTDWEGNPTDRNPVAPTQSPGEIRQTGAALSSKVEGKIEKTNLAAAANENAISAVAPSATTFLIDKAIPGQPSGEFFNQDKEKFKGGTGQAILETAGFVANVGLMATGVGGVAEGVAVRGAEVLAGKAGEAAAQKVVAEEGLAAAEQGLAGAESGLAARQAEHNAANVKFGETSGKRWPQSDVAAQQQFDADRRTVTTTREGLTNAEQKFAEAKKTMPAAEQGAVDATNAASDANHAATQARRAIPDTKSTGQVLGGAAGAGASAPVYDYLDGSSANSQSSKDPGFLRVSEQSRGPAKDEVLSRDSNNDHVYFEKNGQKKQLPDQVSTHYEPVKAEPPVQAAAPAAASTEPVKADQPVQAAAPAAAPAEPVKAEPPVQAAAPSKEGSLDGTPGKSNLGNWFGSDSGHVPQHHPDQFPEEEGSGDMPPPM